MAEDKKKEDQKGEEGKKKKGLPAIVLVAVGAIVGGAGVVFAVPPKVIEKKVEEKPKEFLDVTHPDVIEVTFNPRTRAGKGTARISFKFVYTVREDLEEEAYEQIKTNWDRAKDHVIVILKSRTVEELNSEVGVKLLKHDLIQDLDATMFPDVGHGKPAEVSDLFIVECITQ
ncbi:MAG: flagellar basal body-associated FliL family protein [Planctomycetes bacterium]|nr:flagellar basal body-associated FliL family protein [Planctomycetota bacterium]